MTKIILHGGYLDSWKGAGNDIALFAKLADEARKADGKLLMGFVAKPTLDKFPFIEELKESFKEIAPDVELVIADRDNFRELLPKYKVVFMQGGSSKAHKEYLSDFSNEELLKNKTVLAGSSSGAGQLCNYAAVSKGSQVIDGKGIVNISMIAHAKTRPVDEYLPKLRKYTKDDVIIINESEFVEFVIC